MAHQVNPLLGTIVSLIREAAWTPPLHLRSTFLLACPRKQQRMLCAPEPLPHMLDTQKKHLASSGPAFAVVSIQRVNPRMEYYNLGYLSISISISISNSLSCLPVFQHSDKISCQKQLAFGKTLARDVRLTQDAHGTETVCAGQKRSGVKSEFWNFPELFIGKQGG